MLFFKSEAEDCLKIDLRFPILALPIQFLAYVLITTNLIRLLSKSFSRILTLRHLAVRQAKRPDVLQQLDAPEQSNPNLRQRLFLRLKALRSLFPGTGVLSSLFSFGF